ncbi:putative oxidoreductase [Rhizobium leguminosarum]|uniref:Oxidoreductase n=1 Tax=Rhizobium leguminosarum TaxID=384 RepID=A0AAE2MMF4_RHILE|nr:MULTISPECIES: DoxX family protein [Rhizobium]MBB4292171.1 putative oxidoreductase [Rhizobium leguminosarum]MBB4299720.1 putative oxidoreductase [Rhizobium leguminosarum]MBB4309891.1 putative oxidoreductase [Rhizobium leguminosarum]MBB4419369.1 putative oxidoreductase [Rhizobium leguminosarum]MBB4434172.1 putative oxidoreductase [Rhizobium esperanzae]
MINTGKWTPYVLALLRIITALLFLEHATMKFLQFPGPIQGVPYPLPAILLVAGAIEVITSALMLVGFQTRIAAFIASGEMAAAYFMGHTPYGFWPSLNMGEPAILFCFIFLYIAFAGGGAWTLDNARRSATA